VGEVGGREGAVGDLGGRMKEGEKKAMEGRAAMILAYDHDDNHL
jgi:hypothetical protein